MTPLIAAGSHGASCGQRTDFRVHRCRKRLPIEVAAARCLSNGSPRASSGCLSSGQVAMRHAEVQRRETDGRESD